MKRYLLSEVTLTDYLASHSLVVGKAVDSGGSPNAGHAMPQQSPGNNDPLAGRASPPSPGCTSISFFSQAACLTDRICICNDLIAEPR